MIDWASGGQQQQQEQAQQQEQEHEILAAAIALSLAPAAARPLPLEEYVEADAPESLLCPISLSLFDDPVLLPADGCTYSRAAIEAHFDACRTSESSSWVVVGWDVVGLTGSMYVAWLTTHATPTNKQGTSR